MKQDFLDLKTMLGILNSIKELENEEIEGLNYFKKCDIYHFNCQTQNKVISGKMQINDKLNILIYMEATNVKEDYNYKILAIFKNRSDGKVERITTIDSNEPSYNKDIIEDRIYKNVLVKK